MPARKGAEKDVLGGVYQLLNVGAMTALATVYQSVAPPGAAFDYVVVQSPTAGRFDAMQQPGAEVHIEVHAIANKPDLAKALDIVNKAVDLLDQQTLTMTTQRHLALNWESTETFRDPELVNGIPVFHAIGIFRAYVETV